MPRALDPRPLYLKFRIKLMVKMTRDEMLRELRRIARTGYSSGKIDVRWMDWQKGTEGQINEGRIADEDVLSELRLFYGALAHGGNVRVESVGKARPRQSSKRRRK